jgi:hypothetical protein
MLFHLKSAVISEISLRFLFVAQLDDIPRALHQTILFISRHGSHLQHLRSTRSRTIDAVAKALWTLPNARF